MLVVLNVLMDQKYGFTEEERKDFRELYGDPWFMVRAAPRTCLAGDNR